MKLRRSFEILVSFEIRIFNHIQIIWPFLFYSFLLNQSAKNCKTPFKLKYAKAYFGDDNHCDKMLIDFIEDADQFAGVSHFFWSIWSMLQYYTRKNHHGFAYEKYGKARYNLFKKLMKNWKYILEFFLKSLYLAIGRHIWTRVKLEQN